MAFADAQFEVLTVDPERRRISLSAKKSLIESTLPIVTKFEDAKVGVVTHAVIFKITERGLQVEFYNGLKAFVPSREARYLFKLTEPCRRTNIEAVKQLPGSCPTHFRLEKLSKSA